MQPEHITAVVKESATALGFDLVRITSSEPFVNDEQVALDRLERGLMDGLPWYNEARVRRGSRPEELLPGAKSIIALGMSYLPPKETEAAPR